MKGLAEIVGYIVGSLAAIAIVAMMLAFIAFLMVFGLVAVCIGAICVFILQLCGYDVEAKVKKLM